MLPLLAVFLIVLFNFLIAMRWGIVGMTSSALGTAAALAVFFFAVNRAPEIFLEQTDVPLSWPFTLVIGGVLGVIAFFLIWGLTRPILKFIFKESSFLYRAGRGLCGGVLSIFASAVTVFFLLHVLRIVGTAYELEYVDAIASPDIETADWDELPSPSPFTAWRDQVEMVPKVADLLDFFDPFSRRENRNFGIVTMFAASNPAKEFSQSSSQMASVLSNARVIDLMSSDEMDRLLNMENDRVSLVLGAEPMKVASQLKNRLKIIKVDEHVDEFILYMKTNRSVSEIRLIREDGEVEKVEGDGDESSSGTDSNDSRTTDSTPPRNPAPRLDPTTTSTSFDPSERLDPTSTNPSRSNPIPSLDPTDDSSLNSPPPPRNQQPIRNNNPPANNGSGSSGIDPTGSF